jgi:hypothetical protein
VERVFFFIRGQGIGYPIPTPSPTIQIDTILMHISAIPELIPTSFSSETAIHNKISTDSDVARVALGILAEMTLSFTLMGISMFFVATQQGIALLLATTVAGIVFSTCLTCAGVYLKFKTSSQEDQKTDNKLKLTIEATEIGSALSFSFLDISTRLALIHEYGHKISAGALFINSKAKIFLDPLKGGYTSYSTRYLSQMGKCFGKLYACILISAAGTTLSILASLVDLTAAHMLKKSHRKIARYLNISAIGNIAISALYAMSALCNRSSHGHDFVYLWKAGGIHPLTAAATIIAIPIALKLLLQHVLSS